MNYSGGKGKKSTMTGGSHDGKTLGLMEEGWVRVGLN